MGIDFRDQNIYLTQMNKAAKTPNKPVTALPDSLIPASSDDFVGTVVEFAEDETEETTVLKDEAEEEAKVVETSSLTEEAETLVLLTTVEETEEKSSAVELDGAAVEDSSVEVGTEEDVLEASS